jgi:hypothetical protein
MPAGVFRVLFLLLCQTGRLDVPHARKGDRLFITVVSNQSWSDCRRRTASVDDKAAKRPNERNFVTLIHLVPI